MSELLAPLALLAYGTAAVVGIQLIASGVSHLSSLVARRNGRSGGFGQVPPPQAAMADLVMLAAGLFLLLQGIVVVLWTFD